MRRFVAAVFTLLALAAAASTLYLCAWAEQSRPFVDDRADGPSAVLAEYFARLEAGDLPGADALLAGDASLGLEETPAGPAAARLWAAQRAAWRFEISPGYAMDGTRVVKAAAADCLDWDAMFERVAARVQALLAEDVAAARLRSEVYDENGDYRPELVLAALDQASEGLARDVSPYVYRKEFEVRLLLENGVWRVVPDASLVSALTSGAVSAATDIIPAYGNYVNNLSSAALEGLVYIPKEYRLAEDLTVAPAPDPERFGASEDPADTVPVLEAAAELLDGQRPFFSPDMPIKAGSSVEWYLDDTILALAWKQAIGGAVYAFAEVKVEDASQFRRYLADDTFASPVQYRPSEMARTVNAVVALSGDYYLYRGYGIVTYRRQLCRAEGSVLDTCFVDGDGDLHFAKRGTLTDRADMERYIAENDVVFSLSFGPVMVENGENALPSWYAVGELAQEYPRCVLCQLGPLHYLLLTVNRETPYFSVPTSRAVADTLISMGVETAYALDGGQTGSLVMNGRLYNSVGYNSERSISDIVFFATAIPEQEAGDGG